MFIYCFNNSSWSKGRKKIPQIIKWQKNDWKTANKKPVKNKNLWNELDLMTGEFEIKWSWVKGHSNDVLNNEVDLIAREAAYS